MSCTPKCRMTSSLDEGGRRLMLSVGGNPKFPIDQTLHPQCQGCVDEEILETKAATGDVDARFEVDKKWLSEFKK